MASAKIEASAPESISPETMGLVTETPTGEPKFWRSLEEYAGEKNFDEMVQREFPRFAAEFTDPVSRRKFIGLMGASLALAGMTGCRQPSGTVVPNVVDTEGVIQGKPVTFASAFPLSGYGTGVLVKSYEGRPIKIEGNPAHPSSLGGTDIFAQASLLGMYDPDRAWIANQIGTPTSIEEAGVSLRGALEKLPEGKGVRILTETITSPTLAAQLAGFLKKYPKAVWHEYEPLASDELYQGTKAAFGKALQPVFDFKKADVVVSFEADFLGQGHGQAAYSRQFASRRAAETPDTIETGKGMNRLYAVECMQTITGTKADHRHPARLSQVPGYVAALAAELGVFGANKVPADEAAKKWAKVVAQDLRKRSDLISTPTDRPKGSTLVLAGEHLSAAVHTLVGLINQALGNNGSTISYVEPLAAGRPLAPGRSFGDLVKALSAKEVEFLLIIEANPVHTAPVDQKGAFVEGLKGVATTAYLGTYQDETAHNCVWRLPASHWLETWGDIKGHDGTVAIQQPLIAPLYSGRSPIEFIAELMGDETKMGYELVRRKWMAEHKTNPVYQAAGPFEKWWRRSVHDGFIAGSTASSVAVRALDDAAQGVNISLGAMASKDSLELVFRADESIYDGRFANNGWLMELPKPLSKITWDNAVYMNYKTAEELKIPLRKGFSTDPKYIAPAKDFGTTGGEHGRAIVAVIRLQVEQPGGKPKLDLNLPVWILPGLPDSALVVQLGYGREKAGRVGGNIVPRKSVVAADILSSGKQGDVIGFNTYKLRTSANPWVQTGVKAFLADKEHILACTQAHHSMEGRDPIRVGTVEQNKKTPDWAKGAHAAHEEHPKHDHGHDEKVVHEEKGQKDDHGKKSLALVSKDNILPPVKGFHYTGTHKWGLLIDLTTCTGCNSCVVACQAENNIPVVGKSEVTRGREMHWIRVDRYFIGAPDNPAQIRAHFQPLPCMQCENAPCEQVCPVAATAHSYDGLNDMAYNRCVGTRYCSNNCPYKVRRFNFFQYTDYTTPSLKLLNNPEVTVRSRGVMEKCTYCVQRIRSAEIDAQKEAVRKIDRQGSGRIARPFELEANNGKTPEGMTRVQIKDGAIKTACQQSCPSNAIVFGDLNDHNSAIHRLREDSKRSKTHYSLLEELNTVPRTTYLAALRNPNPAYEAAFAEKKG